MFSSPLVHSIGERNKHMPYFSRALKTYFMCQESMEVEVVPPFQGLKLQIMTFCVTEA